MANAMTVAIVQDVHSTVFRNTSQFLTNIIILLLLSLVSMFLFLFVSLFDWISFNVHVQL